MLLRILAIREHLRLTEIVGTSSIGLLLRLLRLLCLGHLLRCLLLLLRSSSSSVGSASDFALLGLTLR